MGLRSAVERDFDWSAQRGGRRAPGQAIESRTPRGTCCPRQRQAEGPQAGATKCFDARKVEEEAGGTEEGEKAREETAFCPRVRPESPGEERLILRGGRAVDQVCLEVTACDGAGDFQTKVPTDSLRPLFRSTGRWGAGCSGRLSAVHGWRCSGTERDRLCTVSVVSIVRRLQRRRGQNGRTVSGIFSAGLRASIIRIVATPKHAPERN